MKSLIIRYGAFESGVRQYTKKIFLNSCSACKDVCCRPEYCEESLTSPFLTAIRKHFVPDAVYCSAIGWLTTAGCALPVGRPPVCYQFVCETILALRPGPEFRCAVTVLSNLVNHIGQKARGGKHIVELQDPSELNHINFTRIERQLNEAESEFKQVREFLDGNF